MVLSEMTIKSNWDRLSAAVLPPSGGFSEEQMHESRKMFYSGFAACLGLMDDLGDVPEPIAIDVLNSLQAELRAFVDEMAKKGATDASP